MEYEYGCWPLHWGWGKYKSPRGKCWYSAGVDCGEYITAPYRPKGQRGEREDMDCKLRIAQQVNLRGLSNTQPSK